VFELVGVYDPDKSKAGIAVKYGVKFYDDYKQMLGEVDAVTLPCPTSSHKAMAILAAENGVHALIEKPIAENLNDAAEIFRAFSDRGLHCTVGHIERFNPVMKALCEAIEDTDDIVAIEMHRCGPYDGRISDADVVEDLMVHDIDLAINSIMKAKPVVLSALGRKNHSEKYVDYAQTTLCFPNGVPAFITSSRSTAKKIRTVHIHTKDSYIEGDLLNKKLVINRNGSEQIELDATEPLMVELSSFGFSILHDAAPSVTPAQVLTTMEVLDDVEAGVYREYGNGGQR
jgi:predicted dehydrogenase